MTTTVNLRPLLDRKQWEMCSYSPSSSASGSFIVSSTLSDQYQFYINSNTSFYIYDPNNDGWMAGVSPGLAGTFGAGCCGIHHPHGPRAFPTAGTTTTITTNLNLQRSLAGYTIRIIAGPNAGTDAVIASNTTGANSVITVTTPFGSAITTASEFILLSGRTWVLGAGTLASGSWRYYDLATNTWNSKSITNLPATNGTDGRLVSTSGTAAGSFLTGTATSATSTTLVNSAKTWATNSLANYQVRITGGTGAGQFRTISSNTGTTLTVSSAWTTTPDATSVYSIEGNDDYLYFLGNNAVTMYRYSISGDTWTVLAPGVARAGSAVAGMSAAWVSYVTDPSWNNESNFLNGTYIYSFRGNSTALDRYNINTNQWENSIVYSPAADTMSSGTAYCYGADHIYCMLTTGRVIKYKILEQRMEPCTQLFYAQSTTIVGDRFFDVYYTDGGTTLHWLYFMTHSQNTLFRVLLF